MLYVVCQRGYVGWVFRPTRIGWREAVCLQDGVKLEYEASPSAAWGAMVQSLLAHSVLLQGTFIDSHWLQP